MQKNLWDLRLGEKFLELKLKAQCIKGKVDKAYQNETKKQKLLSCKMWQKMLNLVSIWARLESDVRILVPSLCVPLVTMVLSFLCTGQGHFISLDKTYDFYVKWKKIIFFKYSNFSVG